MMKPIQVEINNDQPVRDELQPDDGRESPELMNKDKGNVRQPMTSRLDDGYDSETMAMIEAQINRQVDALKGDVFQ